MIRLKYNAPITLTFAILAATILFFDRTLLSGLTEGLFMADGKLTFRYNEFPLYFRLISYVLGHQNWEHLISNITVILLIGPTLEEKYGSKKLFGIIFITSLLNGLINALFFTTSLMGSSGIAFMMIVLVSFTNIKKGEFPMTSILIISLYLVKEIFYLLEPSEISRTSHIMGGICGLVFGLLFHVVEKKPEESKVDPFFDPLLQQEPATDRRL